MVPSNSDEQAQARRAFGTIRGSVTRSVRGTRSWVNANAYQAIAGILIVPALMFLPFAERRWLMVALALLLTLYNVALAKLVERRGGWTPWLSVVGFMAFVPIMAGTPDLFLPCLVLLTANTAFVARSYGRVYAAGVLGLVTPAIAAVAVWKEIDEARGMLPLWLFAAFSTIGIIGESSDARHRISKQYGTLIDGLGIVVWEGSVDRLEMINDQVVNLLGYEPNMLRGGNTLRRLLHPDDAHVLDFHREQVAAGQDHELRYRIKAANGDIRWLLELVRVGEATSSTGAPSVQGVIIDISERMRAEAGLATYANLVESVGLGMMIVATAEGEGPSTLTITAANPAMSAYNGAGRQLIGRRVADAFAEVLDEPTIAALAEVARCGDTLEVGPVRIQPPDGSARYARLKAFPLPHGEAAVTFEDATAWEMAHAALTYQANHDALTGLPNRSLLMRRMQELVEEATEQDQPLAIILIDVERFREINVSLGHHYGDRSLIEISRRIDGHSGGAAALARLASDEFVVVVTGKSARARADRLASELFDVLSEPVHIDDLTIPMTITMGIAVFPEDADQIHGLLERAEVAVTVAKRSADRITHYDPHADHGFVHRAELLRTLRTGIDEGELTAHYHGIVDLQTGEIVGAEPLVRWHHPQYGLLRANSFIDLAEASGLVGPMTEYMASHAIADLARWRSQGADRFITLNISPRCLYDPTLIGAVLSMLNEAGLEPSALHLEITERALIDDPVIAEEALTFLHDHGCQVAIDDFGSGQSSLSLLRRLPIDELKIDRSFIADLEHGDTRLVRSIIDLGHALGFRVSAEGVETPHILERLHTLGCDRAQGYLFGRPMPADEFAEAAAAPPIEVARHLDWLRSQSEESKTGTMGKVTNLHARRLGRR